MARRQHKLTIAIFALAAALSSTAALAQSPLDEAAQRQLELAERIDQAESRGGPFSEELLAPLSELALLYQETDDRALASLAIKRVLQVVRANYGLYSLAQAPLLAQLSANEEPIGNRETAWELDDELLTLARRHPADLRTVAILRGVGDKRMRQLRLNEVPWELVCRGWELKTGCDDLATRGWPPWGQTLLLQGAMNNWGDAINVLLHHELYGSPELRELEQKIIEVGSCDAVRASYGRLIYYDEATAQPWLARAATMVAAADTELVCAQTHSGSEKVALEHYRDAYELLERNGVARESIDELFSPDSPVILVPSLPVETVRMAASPASASERYVDVRFEIATDGRARKIDIVAATVDTSNEEKHRVRDFIRDSLYRPRAADGRIAGVSVMWRCPPWRDFAPRRCASVNR